MSLASKAIDLIATAALPGFFVLLTVLVLARIVLTRTDGRLRHFLSRLVEDIGDVSVKEPAGSDILEPVSAGQAWR